MAIWRRIGLPAAVVQRLRVACCCWCLGALCGSSRPTPNSGPRPALHAAGDDITSKQLRDDLMTLLIAGHETSAAVLTWTFHCIADRPDVIERMREEVRAGLGW